MKIHNDKGISLITLIITIIVIVILASVAMIASDEPVDKSQAAKKEAEIAQEKQILTISLKDAVNIFNGEVEKETLEENLSGHSAIIDASYVPDEPTKVEYKVVFKKTGNSYLIDELGGITVLDKVYADNTTPSNPSNPSNPSTPSNPSNPSNPGSSTGNKVTIGGKDVSLIGDIANMEFEKNADGFTLGLQFASGDVFAYNGELYIAKDGPYITNAQRDQILNSAIKLNLEKGIIIPDSNTVQGDIKAVGDDLYVYRPYSSDPNAWQWDNYWLKLNMNPLYEFK